jgi:hypothetical protein
MVQSVAKTVLEYLNELPPERSAVMRKVRALVRQHLPKGYAETVDLGMITWGVPLAQYPTTYNGQPLCYVALAAQKNHYALYLMGCYMDPAATARLAAAYKAAGKKLDMGKSCVRFKSFADLVPDAIAQAVRLATPAQLIARHEAIRKKSR